LTSGDAVVIVSCGRIVMESVADPVCWFASVTVTLGVLVPAAVGVPLITPLPAIFNPAGKPVAEKV
jgi:hypothetical protein